MVFFWQIRLGNENVKIMFIAWISSQIQNKFCSYLYCTSSFRWPPFSLFTSSLEPSGEDMLLRLGTTIGLVDLVQVGAFSGQPSRGSVPCSQREVPRPDDALASADEGGLDFDNNFSPMDSVVPRPEDEVVLAVLSWRRRSSSSVFWFSTSCSSLEKKTQGLI